MTDVLCKDTDSDDSAETTDVEEQSDGILNADFDPPPVRILLVAFMFMFQGYGCMVGAPQHALKHKLEITHDQAADFQAMNFLLLALVTAVARSHGSTGWRSTDGRAIYLAAFIANFGNGLIYGLCFGKLRSAKFIDWKLPEEHRYAAYNLWCFIGDIGGYVGQGALSVALANHACDGRHYEYVCNANSRPLHRAAAAGNGEICLELCKRKECRIGLKDRDGRTALQVAKHWGFSAAADAIFRASALEGQAVCLTACIARVRCTYFLTELRLRRQRSFRNFLEEAAVVAASEKASQEGSPTRTMPISPAGAVDSAIVEDSDCETDPGMPELQPLTPRPVAEVKSPKMDLSPSDSDGQSPHRLDGGGDFNKCWGRGALKDALKGMDAS
ncbi:unnamed protein product [Effrenium voratum]|nr:unnamed protein product [Effrenium voratum]